MTAKWWCLALLAGSACGGLFNKKPVWIDPAGDIPLVITNNSKHAICTLDVSFSDLKEPPGADPNSVSKPHYRGLAPLDAPGQTKSNQLAPGASVKVGVTAHQYDVVVADCDNLYSAYVKQIDVHGPAAFGIDGPERTTPETYARTEIKLEFHPPSSGGSSGGGASNSNCVEANLHTERGPASCCSGRGILVTDSPYVSNKEWRCE